MNVRHPTGVLHSFSIKNIIYDKMDLTAFLFLCDDLGPCLTFVIEIFATIVNSFVNMPLKIC